MAEAGQALEGYRSSPDRVIAFEALAEHFVEQNKARELEQLLAEHGRQPAPGPDYVYYRAKAAWLGGDFRAAEEHFTKALAQAAGEQQDTVRHELYRVRVKTGKVVRTYSELGGGKHLFETLAHLCVGEQDVGQLQALIAARRKSRPDDARVAFWDLEVKWLKRDYAGVLAPVTATDGSVAGRSYCWKRDEYLVRCLVKLGKAEQAVREAEALAKLDRGNRVLLVLAHAARGGAPGAIAAVEKSRRGQVSLLACYQDDDLGPLLRSEPFRAFRQKFPQPKADGRPGEARRP